jgi:hypothetical protein
MNKNGFTVCKGVGDPGDVFRGSSECRFTLKLERDAKVREVANLESRPYLGFLIARITS